MNCIVRKAQESADTKVKFFSEEAERLQSLAGVMGERFSSGHCLFVAGNGGSSCDSDHASVEFMHPIIEKRRSFPCISLVSSSPMISAISNDLDFSQIFSLQLKRLAKPGDMLLGLSTSGSSPNLVRVFQMAKEMNVSSIAVLGKDGGRLVDLADWSFVVPSFSIHRIQEVHVTFIHILWDLIHIQLGEEDIV
jgi:D-sedoheptulose 7-phosphate isomerase